MTTTTTVTIGAAQLAGAVGLGIASLAAQAIVGSVVGGRGGGRGGGSRRGSHNRYGRDLKDEREALDNLLEMVFLQDGTGCGMKLVCDLAGKEEDELVGEDLNILALVGPGVPPGEGLLPKSGADVYRNARYIGETGAPCDKIFASCPMNGTEIRGITQKFLHLGA
ncbi:uncharacterized protein LOC135221419 [Macrobrachium nipponense]|uniref:uncharacterized protein LOC135221419 n=1 Tax=Macrobrachium nipponense TaxID=159736 RepID=UPI0030C7BCC6